MKVFSPLTNKQLFSNLLLMLALVFTVPLQAQQFSQRIYPGVAPGSEDWIFEEVVQSRDGDNQVYYNVRDPELTAYLPAPESANGTAIIILPGGALRFLSVGQETADIIEFLNAAGIAVFHLKYRVLQEDLEAPARPRAIGPGNLPTLEIINGNANPMPDHEGLNGCWSWALMMPRKRCVSCVPMPKNGILIHPELAFWGLQPGEVWHSAL